MNADEAYAQCEQITWEQARNFAYGIRLLPPDKRRALAAVYAYARRIDDIGDGDLPAADKTEQLEAARRQVHALVERVKGGTQGSAGEPVPDSTGLDNTVLDDTVLDDTDPVLVALTDTGRRFDVPLEAFEELIEGCLADVVDPSRVRVDGGEGTALLQRQQPDAIGEVPGLLPGDLLALGVGFVGVHGHLPLT